MAEINPPLYLDQDDAYGAAELGLPFRDIMGEGVVGSGDLAVTAGTGLNSSVAAGAAWIAGDNDANAQPTYRVRNDAARTMAHNAADATNPRIDIVIAEVLDATFSGVSKLWRLRVVTGVPAASPAAPALPVNAIELAEVRVNAGSGTLTSVTDKRTRAKVGSGAASSNGPTTYRKTTQKAVNTTVAPTDLLNGEITIAAGILGANGAVRLRVWGDWLQNIGTNQSPPRFQVVFGGVTLVDTNAAAGISSSATRYSWELEVIIMNTAAGAQIVMIDGTVNTNTSTGGQVAFTVGTGDYLEQQNLCVIKGKNTGLAVDTTLANLLKLNVINGNAGAAYETRLDGALVEVI